MTKIFHNSRCSKSRAAVELLESRGVNFEVVNYLDNPPSAQELEKIVEMLGIKPEQLARRGEKRFKELGLSEKELSDQEWLSVLAANPILIERPIVVHGARAAIGRPIDKIVEIIRD